MNKVQLWLLKRLIWLTRPQAHAQQHPRLSPAPSFPCSCTWYETASAAWPPAVPASSILRTVVQAWWGGGVQLLHVSFGEDARLGDAGLDIQQQEQPCTSQPWEVLEVLTGGAGIRCQRVTFTVSRNQRGKSA